MHFVTEGKSEEEYDRGPVFFHKDVPIHDDDTAATLGDRVNKCEHVCQPLITNLVVNRMITWNGVDPASLKIPDGYKIRNPY